MGFLDKAKAAANDLAARADQAMSGAGISVPGTGPGATGTGGAGGGDAERYFRDLGVLAYLEAQGRGTQPAERERILAALRDLEERGAIRSFDLHTAAPPPPGHAGDASSPPSPISTPPPPGGGPGLSTPPDAPHRPAPGSPGAPPSAPPSAPPPQAPPPPSWMTKEEGLG